MKKILIMLLSLALAFSCSERVDLPQHETPPHLNDKEQEENQAPEQKPEEENPGDGKEDEKEDGKEEDKDGKEVTLRLCSYNVGLFSKSKATLGHYSYPEAAALLTEMNVDVVGLNETDKGNKRTDNHYQAEELAKELGKDWTTYFAYAHNLAYGNSIVAAPEYKVVKQWERLLIPKGDGSENRSSGAVEYEDFVFCVTHLDHESVEARKKGVEIITQWALENYGKDKTHKPVFLVGDMNCISTEVTIANLEKNWKLISAKELTYPSDKPKKCIDYIFVLDNGVEVKAGESHAVTTSVNVDVSTVSDHCPIYCDVTFIKHN